MLRLALMSSENRAASSLASNYPGGREAFVAATVVRVERPTSVQPGDVALVREDGTIEGFVGGQCAQSTVRAQGLAALQSLPPVRADGRRSGPADPAPAA